MSTASIQFKRDASRVAADLDHRLIEDYGIAPDHYLLMDDISIENGEDQMLERAVQLLDSISKMTP